jgi:hypothetical protein
VGSLIKYILQGNTLQRAIMEDEDLLKHDQLYATKISAAIKWGEKPKSEEASNNRKTIKIPGPTTFNVKNSDQFSAFWDINEQQEKIVSWNILK